MKEIGIIFSADMVKAILNGQKTQTRRVIKPQPIKKENLWEYGVSTSKDISMPLCLGVDEKQLIECMLWHCPYGQVGDKLWVRETHYRWGRWVKNGLTKTGKQAWTFKAVSNTIAGLRFPDNRPPFGVTDRTQEGWHKRPSIFMPRWASRITLEITEVRVERVQEITEEDAKAEGVDWYSIENKIEGISRCQQAFRKLWDSLNAKRKPTKFDREQGITELITPSYEWASNPRAWVISFGAMGVRIK